LRISRFRKGMPIGCAVTLRGDHMYEFLEPLVQRGASPRVRELFAACRRIPSTGRGNYTLGLKRPVWCFRRSITRAVGQDQGHEHHHDDPGAKNDEQGRELLKGAGVSRFAKKEWRNKWHATAKIAKSLKKPKF